MRLAQLLVALAILTGIFGRRDALAREFTAQFPPINGSADGSLDIRALPVTLHDEVGVVQAIQITVADSEDVGPGRVVALRGRPNVVRIDWLGGACDNRTDILLTEASAIRITVDPAFDFIRYAGSCPTIPVYRSLVLQLNRPIDLTAAEVVNLLD
jgi:hypothetical protein